MTSNNVNRDIVNIQAKVTDIWLMNFIWQWPLPGEKLQRLNDYIYQFTGEWLKWLLGENIGFTKWTVGLKS